MAKVENVSPRGSMKGWKFQTWLIRNKDNVKLIVSGLVGIIAYAVSGLSPALSASLGGIVTILSKLVLDGIDYYASNVTLPPAQ